MVNDTNPPNWLHTEPLVLSLGFIAYGIAFVGIGLLSAYGGTLADGIPPFYFGMAFLIPVLVINRETIYRRLRYIITGN